MPIDAIQPAQLTLEYESPNRESAFTTRSHLRRVMRVAVFFAGVALIAHGLIRVDSLARALNEHVSADGFWDDEGAQILFSNAVFAAMSAVLGVTMFVGALGAQTKIGRRAVMSSSLAVVMLRTFLLWYDDRQVDHGELLRLFDIAVFATLCIVAFRETGALAKARSQGVDGTLRLIAVLGIIVGINFTAAYLRISWIHSEYSNNWRGEDLIGIESAQLLWIAACFHAIVVLGWILLLLGRLWSRFLIIPALAIPILCSACGENHWIWVARRSESIAYLIGDAMTMLGHYAFPAIAIATLLRCARTRHER